MPSDRAKVFWSGRSQAVRLPKKYRVDATEMRIRKQGKKIILEPVATGWEWLDELDPFDDDMVAAINEGKMPPMDESKYRKMWDE